MPRYTTTPLPLIAGAAAAAAAAATGAYILYTRYTNKVVSKMGLRCDRSATVIRTYSTTFVLTLPLSSSCSHRQTA